ncbi:MAG: dihydroneopterin aldolase [Henriciella sp.]|jgi:dihydroneopterin aldolase|uniref:dihydroneopterin aldolase n=1 Tax=Henriciella sp. TaxID=1968823 RepID=UPI000C102B51|nr:dihydroneopterin aldolase [Henriciella sp.]MAN74245.1 dihydroneopterin aldolase [Henriciella sp.]MBF33202.1 dihydroneopterin aldolase [Hyphomonadaceae bacterium]MBK75978.1 dihydroneopterin aldolase [Henriciella sp.]PHR69576.1 MAG: dihydroneopterin aldolase [Henriciella sp.]|tara:strand:- start:1334 stop:1702 length:369 start_codon:yes stop_codon:yes gene_type:complete
MRRTERVFVENLGIHGFHGLIAEEQRLGQKFYADIECLVARQEAPSDTMKDAVDYGKVCDLAHEISASGPFNLIETLAERIGQGVMETFPLVSRVRVRIRKPNAPIRHFLDHVGVEIELSRD